MENDHVLNLISSSMYLNQWILIVKMQREKLEYRGASAIFEFGFWFTIIPFDRPCSQIDEEIEDDDETSSSLGGSGGNSGLEDDSEMTYVNTLETKQVWGGLATFHLPISSKMNPNSWIENWIRTVQCALPLVEVGVGQVWMGNESVTYYRKSVCMVADLHKNLNILEKPILEMLQFKSKMSKKIPFLLLANTHLIRKNYCCIIQIKNLHM